MKKINQKSQDYRNYKDWMPIKEEIQSKGILRKFKEWEICKKPPLKEEWAGKSRMYLYYSNYYGKSLVRN